MVGSIIQIQTFKKGASRIDSPAQRAFDVHLRRSFGHPKRVKMNGMTD
jgi:hypothetical protein